MLDQDTKRRIDSARQILVGKVPDPKAQVEQITTALIYKFMDDMDRENEELGGKAKFLTGKLKQFSWGRLLSKELSGQGRMIAYMDALTAFSKADQIPELFRTIFKGTFLPYRDPETLNLFLKEINEFTYDHSEQLGNAYEYLLSILGSQGDAGQFRTPRHIIDFIVEVVDPKKNERILDPACGTAGFLISAYKHIKHQNSSNYKKGEYIPSFSRKASKDVALVEIQANGQYAGDKLSHAARMKLGNNIIGYDISPDMVRLSLVNMYLHGFNTPQILEYDSLTYEDRWGEMYDVILANPPFMTPKGGIRPHKRFQISANRSEVLFVDYMAEHLTLKGRAGVIVPEGIIFQSSNAYKNLRKMLIEDNFLWAVVSLPAGVFKPYSGVKTSVFFFDRERSKKNNEILFVKVNNDGFDLGDQRRAFSKNDLPDAYKILQDWQKDEKTESPLANWVDKKSILESGDYNLTGDRYRDAIVNGSIDWPMVKLNDVLKIQSGFAFDSKKFSDEDGVPIIRIRNIKTNHTDTKYKGDYSNNYIVMDGDLLIGMDGEFNNVIWRGGKALLNQRVCKLFDFENALKEYIFYLTKKSLKEIEDSTYAVTVKHISAKQIKNIEIPLPPLDVQREIVAKLDGYQRVIDGARQIIGNWKPTMKIDPEWELVKLGDISENLDGKRVPIEKSKRKAGDYPYYGASGIVDYVDDFLFDDDLLLVSEDGANLKARVTPIAFSVSGKVWVNNHAHVIKFKHLATQVYVELYLNSISLDNYITGAAQPKLNQKNLSRIPIPLPRLREQKQIVSEIENEQKAVESAKKLIQIHEQKIKDIIAEVWGE